MMPARCKLAYIRAGIIIGLGVATLIAGSYLGLSTTSKPYRVISTKIDKLTDIKRVGYAKLLSTLSSI